MLVRAVGITSERVKPRVDSRPGWPNPERVRWLVLSADHATRRVIVVAVRRHGAVCHVVNGQGGPSRASVARPYDIAFIDIAHPLGDGRGLDGWVDSLRLSRCRLVVRAADGDTDGERWARERGAVLYLPGRLDVAGFTGLLGDLTMPRPRVG